MTIHDGQVRREVEGFFSHVFASVYIGHVRAISFVLTPNLNRLYGYHTEGLASEPQSNH